MRIAVLANVRANLPALEAVLADEAVSEAHAIWCLGNFIGWGPFPCEVVDRLRQVEARCILGADELLLLKFRQMRDSAHRAVQQAFAPLRYAHAHLSEEHHRFIGSLPRQLELSIEGRRIVVVHGSAPFREPGDTIERLRVLAEESHAQVVVYGHGLQPDARRIDGVTYVHPGSVGHARPADASATYCLLTLTERVVRRQVRRIAYPMEDTAQAFTTRDLPPTLAEALLQGVEPAQEREPALPREQEDPRLLPVLELARSCEYEAEHTHQVTRLALKLFDELAPVHRLGPQDRFLLHCAALLHDIGWVEGQQAHHKTALRIILTSPLLPFEERERLIIGSVARYHRKAVPSPTHEHYTVLPEEDRRRVAILAGILRVADGLDRTHRSLVDDFTCHVSPKKITLRCRVHWPAEMERQAALDKGQLLESALGRHLSVEWHLA